MQKMPESQQYAPGEGGALGLFLVCGALILAVFVRSRVDDVQAHNEKFNAYLKSRGCVAATMEGRSIASYRCDSPTAGEYVPAGVLYRQANGAATGGAS